ncbi:MAG: hypothetical protein KAS82_04540 [Bacteroidales bacterium]|nr:hypothetical protein [Bacteroidales bacterium]
MRFGNFLVRILLIRQLNFLKNRKRLIRQGLAGVILILLINFIAGCYYYKVSTSYQPPAEELVKLSDLDKQFVVHNFMAHYFVHSVTFHKDSLELKLRTVYYQEGDDISPVSPNQVKRYRKKKGDARLLNEVHLYVNQKRAIDETTWMVPNSAVERLDIYNHSTKHTTTYSILFGVALIPVAYVAFLLLFLLVMLLTGNSCPFIYTWNGEAFEFAGEIYSGAVYPPLERHDYLLLPGLVEEDGEYRLKISNQLEEVQHTNLLELMVYDHAADQEVMVDKYGVGHIISEPVAPVSAISLRGEEVLPLIEKEDDLVYLGNDPSRDPPLLDGVKLTYNIPHGIKTAHLVISAKNSYWLDFVYQNFREMLGASYKMWMKRQQDGDPKQMESWSLSQNIPLSVYLFKDGAWEFYDYYNTVGPMAFKKDILELDLSDIEKGPLRIKLEAGSYFWEIGYVGVSLEQTAPEPATIVQLSKAVDENGNNVAGNLLKDDALYYVQPEIGDEAELVFPVPDAKGERTIILHSKGYYEILQDPKGPPRVKALKEIRKTGNFNKYSNELMQEMLEEHIWAYDNKEK